MVKAFGWILIFIVTYLLLKVLVAITLFWVLSWVAIEVLAIIGAMLVATKAVS